MRSKHELRRIAAVLVPGDALLDVFDWIMPIIAVTHANGQAHLTCIHPIDGIELIKYDQRWDVSTMRMT